MVKWIFAAALISFSALAYLTAPITIINAPSEAVITPVTDAVTVDSASDAAIITAGPVNKPVWTFHIPRGYTGPQGSVGAQGATGPDGAVGATGSQGTTGPVGATGPKGDVGDIGPQGLVGVTGGSGATGSPGPEGDTGSTGAQGATGNQGLKGDTGATGAAGAQGVPGSTGSTGATGAVGATGAQGATGLTGTTGVAGPTGIAGTIGATGATGAAGTIGATGATGPAGVILATAPLTLTSSVLAIPVSTNSVAGYLSSADHTSFAAKFGTVTYTVLGVARAFNTTFVPSTTLATDVCYSIKLSCSFTLGGTCEGTADLRSDAASPPVTSLGLEGLGASGTLVIGITLTSGQTTQICGKILPNHNARIVTTTVSGSPSFTLVGQREVTTAFGP